MRDDVKIVAVDVDDRAAEDWRRMALQLQAKVRELQEEVAALERRRDYDRTMRDLWHDQWRRDADLRASAERRAAAAERLLSVTADLLVAWTTCHEDPGLARRTEQVLDEVADARDVGGL